MINFPLSSGQNRPVGPWRSVVKPERQMCTRGHDPLPLSRALEVEGS
jgi:hypothetical protein